MGRQTRRSFLKTGLGVLAIAPAALAGSESAGRSQQAAGPNAGPAAGRVQLPGLNWTQRSDWINVKTDVTPAAVGDGKADDTAALQAALTLLSEVSGQRNTVYLPPGTYRVTGTLELKQKDGVALIGHGRDTRVVWDGPAGQGDDSRIFWSNGSPRSRYVGITWDGANKAFIGFDHDSHGYFETEIDHQCEAFINCTGSGLRVGHNQGGPGAQATAETTYENCLFANCDRGAAFLTFNDYNHTLTGCEFRQCGTGVYGGKGCNFYVRDSHFEGSRVTDIVSMAEHGVSARRCTSQGSAMFFQQSSIAPAVLQDCCVAGWANPTGAVSLNYGPVMVFDCAFTRPPTRHAPITTVNGQKLILSNNISPGTDTLVMRQGPPPVEVPPGRLGGSVQSPDEVFFRETWPVPGRVFDARRDFGCKGDGKADDTAAIQAAIDAARAAGHAAIAYLPSGDYVVTKTLDITGKDYRLGGSGTHTRLIWRGPKDGVLVHVHDPLDVTIENMSIGDAGQQENGVDILQTGSGAASRVHYERVWVFGMYSKQPGRKGLLCQDLPHGTVIVARHFTGNLRFHNCGRASILLNTSFEGAIEVDGKADLPRDGMLGFLTRLETIELFGVYVNDSQNLVMSDYYVEQSDEMLSFSGGPGDPAGSVTIQLVKCHTYKSPVVQSQDYHGRIAIGPSMPYPGGVEDALYSFQGANPLDLVFMACQAYGQKPRFECSPAVRRIFVQNTGEGMGPDEIPPGGLEAVSAALDDQRRLGMLDLALNYPGVRQKR
jgi:hypothetical protein